MLVAVLGTILPPMIILSVISFFYAVFVNNIWVAVVLKGMQAAVAAVILDAACDLGINAAKEKSILSGIIFIAAFVCDFIFQLNVIYIILAAVVLGIIKTFILKTVSQFFASWSIQHRRWLCSDSYYSKSSGGFQSLAFYGRVYQPCHHRRNDARPCIY